MLRFACSRLKLMNRHAPMRKTHRVLSQTETQQGAHGADVETPRGVAGVATATRLVGRGGGERFVRHLRSDDRRRSPADVNEDDKREAIAVVFGSPAPVVQATCKQELELEGGAV